MIEPNRLPAFLEEVKRELQQQIKREQFDSWFRGFHVVRISKQEIEFGVPTGFVRDWLTRNYHSLIADAVHAAGLRLQWIPLELEPSARVRFVVHHGPGRRVSPELEVGPETEEGGQSGFPALDEPLLPSGDASTSGESLAEGDEVRRAPGRGLPPSVAETGGLEHTMDAVTKAKAGLGGSTPEPKAPRRADSIGEVVLNSGYTFDQFVVGPCNRLAHAAALAISESPGRAYNPLYIHGGVGLGKTHLLQAVCHGILRRQRGARVLYVSCEEFTNRFIHSIQSGRLEEFRNSFRGADVLVVDDVQFMGGKERTQEEFFHTFNALYNSQKQIVISSDHSPAQTTTIEDRILSRFKWGLVTEIEQPCFETRVAIVKRKARLRGADFDDEISYFIAERMATNIRELEGAVIKVVGFSSIMERPITLGLVEEALQGSMPTQTANVTFDQIVNLVVQEFSVTLRDMMGKSRSQPHAFPRQIAMFIVRDLLQMPFEEMGRRFGGRDHTTVMYSVQKVRERMNSDRNFRELVTNIVKRLGGSTRSPGPTTR